MADLEFIQNIRGPAGFNATGAAEDAAALADFVNETAGINDFSDALKAKYRRVANYADTRPATSLPVLWFGGTEPGDADNGDEWINLTTGVKKVKVGGAFVVHTHDAADIISGTLALARLPVAASAEVSATKVVRADDSRLTDPLAAWSAYTPAWTSGGTAPALGNGTLVGHYMKTGRTVQYRITLTMGSTTTFGTGAYMLSLPFATNGAVVGHSPMGKGTVFDTSAGAINCRTATYNSSTTVVLRDEAGLAVAATTPFTFANGDRIMITGTYESAS